MEAQPVQFLARDLPGLLAGRPDDLGAFVGADPDDLAFVTNATGAVNAVVRSLRFEPGDELLTDDHEYNATINVLRHVAERDGARVVVARIPFPSTAEDEVVEAILGGVTERTRLAPDQPRHEPDGARLPDRADRGRASPSAGSRRSSTAPTRRGCCRSTSIGIGAAWYTGNLHKWVCAPKGAGFLHARRDRQAGIRPEHDLARRERSSARAPTAAPATAARRATGRSSTGRGRSTRRRGWPSPDALRHVGGLVDGGWPAVMARNHELTLRARPRWPRRSGSTPARPRRASMLGSMVALPLPSAGRSAMAGAGSSPLDTDPLQQRLIDSYRIEVPIYPWPVPAANRRDRGAPPDPRLERAPQRPRRRRAPGRGARRDRGRRAEPVTPER